MTYKISITFKYDSEDSTTYNHVVDLFNEYDENPAQVALDFALRRHSEYDKSDIVSFSVEIL